MKNFYYPSMVFVFYLILVSALAELNHSPSLWTTPNQMIIDNAGYPRTMEVAKDEIYIQSKLPLRHAPATHFPTKASAETLHQYAQSLDNTKKYNIYLVLYEKGKPRNEKTRCLLSDEILVELKPGTDPLPLAKQLNATVEKPAGGLPDNFHRFIVSKTGNTLGATQILRQNSNLVLSAEPLLIRKKSKRGFPNDPLFPKQWYLNNTGQNNGTSGIDCHVSPVWSDPFGAPGSLLGRNIRIGIIDDGLQVSHPDLKPNVDIKNGYDFLDQDNSPNPSLALNDSHGTSVAGLAAAKENNNNGVSGVAPEAKLVGLRIMSTDENLTDTGEAKAFTWKNDIIQIKNNSWGPVEAFIGPGTQASSALKKSAIQGRQGLGTIFVWAAGNNENADGDTLDNANYDGYANSIYTIAVGGVNALGKVALPYDTEPGANLIVCAPTLNITTTDLIGKAGDGPNDYIFDFGGTSAATPLVSGVIALMLEKNPNLGWRDAQEILIRSAKKVDDRNKDWINNAAGFHFNHSYGAGLVDAEKAVKLSASWKNLSPQKSATLDYQKITQLPEGNEKEIVFNIKQNLRVEHVTFTLTLSHDTLWDLSISLTSPSGTLSQLKQPTINIYESGTHFKWTFMTVHNWGETSQGTWKVSIKDSLPNNKTGELKKASLTIYGTETL
ncbi:MAG: S8 family serine peptidase [Verrucomicrobiae bacterium]|nr:S8 family serine peptidase [Verrucomicrobiae bacterium]